MAGAGKGSKIARRSIATAVIAAAAVIVAFGLLATESDLPRATEVRARYELAGFWHGEDASSGALQRPFGIAASPNGDVYVTDARRRVVRFGPEGDFKGEWGGAGSEPGQFENPVGVAVAADGSVFVTDYDLDRVQKFTPDGEYLFELGGPGSGPGEFDSPTGVTVDHTGAIYVADFYNSRVVRFRPDGTPLDLIGHAGRLGKGALNYPTDVQVSSDATLIVADAYNYQIQWFDPTGQPVRRAGRRLLWLWPRPASSTGGFNVPTGLAAAAGLIHVADSGNHRVVMLTAGADYVSEWKIPDPVHGVHSPEKVAVSPDGRFVYVTDYPADRIAVLRVVKNGAEL